jgi:hypothetical protein
MPNVLFTCQTLRMAIDELLDERGSSYRPTRRPHEPLPTVNGATIRSFRRLLRSVPFSRKIG